MAGIRVPARLEGQDRRQRTYGSGRTSRAAAATIGNLFDAALDRMAQVLRSAEESHHGGEASRFSAEQARLIREKMATIRSRLHESLRHFSVRLHKPEPKQMLVAELSTLWVILENARPERMKGYGAEFLPQDKDEWESLIEYLMHETELIRATVLKGKEAHGTPAIRG